MKTCESAWFWFHFLAFFSPFVWLGAEKGRWNDSVYMKSGTNEHFSEEKILFSLEIMGRKCGQKKKELRNNDAIWWTHKVVIFNLLCELKIGSVFFELPAKL